MTFEVAPRPPALRMPADYDARWKAVVDRDASADGTFYYSVATTGVYCRPSCPSRLAKPANVRFHATREDAERAGYRPCRRCRPDEPPPAQRNAAAVAAVCRAIEAAEAPPTLADLARVAGLSPSHLHRLFKAATGVTPRAYAEARRAGRVRAALVAGERTVTDAYVDAGFASSGRFYSAAPEVLGMPPAAYRDGGAGTTVEFAIAQCSLGALLVARSDRGVCAITLGDDPEALARGLQDRFPRARLTAGDEAFEALIGRVVALVEAPALGHDLPLDIRGTAFQLRVWQALRGIPAGATVSYSELARRIGSPGAARAVARACAANPLAVAVPCHRVVALDGSPGGYRWGVERKRALLAREAGASEAGG